MTKVDILITRYAHLTNMKMQALEQSLKMHDPQLFEIYMHEFEQLKLKSAEELEKLSDVIREFESLS